MHPAEVEKNKFFEFADFKPTDIIWDFGCGDLRFTLPLSKMGCQVYPTDRKWENKAPVELIDKFLISCVLHYNPYWRKLRILNIAYNQLKPGGYIIIIEPNPYNPFFYCLYFWRWLIRSKCPRRWHNEKYMSTRYELIDMLAQVGFKNIEIMKYAWFPSKFGWLKLNIILNKMPILGIMNAFNWVKGIK